MVKIEDELKNMEEGIRRLKVEYQIFFNGNRKKPPEDLRLKLERTTKHLSDRSDMSQAQRFRYNTLLTRYYTFKNLWRRTTLKQERGKETESKSIDCPKPVKKKTVKERIRLSLSDPKTEVDKVKSLFDTLVQCQKANSEEFAISYRQFAKYITAQTEHIRLNKGCSSVTFTIALEEDVVRFTATAENP
jgi:hypothetical protein